MALINTITAVIALVLSLSSFIYSIINSYRLNKINMRLNYFDLFKDDITKKFPEYFTKFITDESLQFNDEIGKSFENFINDFRYKIKFLMFIDAKNYKKLDNYLIKLEEEIIILPTRKENKIEHIKKINVLIENIYSILSNHFT